MYVIFSGRIQAGKSVWRILNINRSPPHYFVDTYNYIVDGEVVAIRIHGGVLRVRPS